ncbi:MAG TPA: mechanosensitive ion channel domain-containing protein [Burkholderiaceae bacterium]|nr:mechanosensitive ion channel domain-containing protein [Burkholderiaceae bacterium]
MNRQTLFEEVVHILRNELSHPAQAWQLALIAVALLAGWVYARRIQQRARETLAAAATAQHSVRVDVLKFSIDGFRRLAFPVAAMLLIVLSGLALYFAGVVRSGEVHLLRLALLLLGAMAAIRLFVYILRRSLSRATWIGTFEVGIALTIWIMVALHVTGLLNDLIDHLDSIRFPLGKPPLTLWDILAGVVSVILTVLAALWAGSVIEANLMGTKGLAPNSRVVLARLIKALLTLLAVLVALSFVGIDLTLLSVFGGALGVGLGLGLQKIASNYVSGFIILLDRSLSIGDMITVDKFYGAVSQINARYTVIKALDGTETILPNEMLVSTPVINQSYTNTTVQIAVKLTIAYSADLDRALQILIEAAAAQPRVLADPEPAAFVTGFGADGIDLQVGFWIRDPEAGSLPIRSDIARTVLRRFRQEQIEIPSPQREIRIKSIPEGLTPSRALDPSENQSTEKGR